MRDLPLINLAGSPSLASEVEAACHTIGFMYVRGHGIAAGVFDAVRAAVSQYFSLPLDVKLADRITRDNYRGYIPEGFFNANSGDGAADRYEGYKLHAEVALDDPVLEDCHLYGPNKWPAAVPELCPAIERYWAECDRVTTKLLSAMAEVLGVGADALLAEFRQPLTNMTLLHYPPQEPDDNGFGIHPHKDTDALTILAPDPVGGLMVRRRDDAGWIAANPPGDALTVNIGDMMELWSGGYFVSTPHKVVNSSGSERYSFPYFAVPGFDTVVEPLSPPQPGFARDSVPVGAVSAEVWRTNWQGVVSDKPQFDLGTLENE